MSTANKFIFRSGKTKNKPKQADNKRDKLKLNLPEKYFDQKDKLDLWLI